MKILLVANANNFWVHAFIYHVIPSGDEIYLLNEHPIKNEYKNTFKERNVSLLGTMKPIYNIPKVGSRLRKRNYCRAIKQVGHFDYCIILNTTSYRLTIWNEIKELCTKTTVLYWGSDIHRVSKKELLVQKKYLDNVDKIVFTAQNLKMAFTQLFPRVYDNKLFVIHFGLESLAHIDEIKKNYKKDQIKTELSIPKNKKIVAVGYCGIPEQQHERVINEISQLNKSLKSQICIMLQFMYNTSTAYREHIISILKREEIDYIVFNKFLSQRELAKLRVATDYFINAQTTDAIAGGMLESLYAGAVLINGSWLEYPEFSEWGIKCLTFDDFNSLGRTLIEAFNIKESDSAFALHNLFEEMNWNVCKLRWHEMIEL